MDVESDKTELELPDLTSYTKYQVRIWPHTEAGKGQELVMSATTEPAGNQYLVLLQYHIVFNIYYYGIQHFYITVLFLTLFVYLFDKFGESVLGLKGSYAVILLV